MFRLAGVGRPLAAGLLLAFACGCSSAPRRPVAPPRRLAVLPFDNRTNDAGAADYVRNVMAQRLPARRFTVLPQAGVDDALRNLGVSQGGQLGVTTPGRVAAATGAELLLYGRVEQFTYITAGVAEKRAVKVSARLVDPSGRVHWAATRSSSNGGLDPGAASSLGAFGRALGGQLTEKLVEGAVSHRLAPETRACVDALIVSIPPRL